MAQIQKNAISNHFSFKNTKLIIVSSVPKTKQNANMISPFFVGLLQLLITTLATTLIYYTRSLTTLRIDEEFTSYRTKQYIALANHLIR